MAHPVRANLDATGGLLMAENVAAALAPTLGRAGAQAVVSACCARAVERGAGLRDVMASDDDVLRALSVADLDALFEPMAALGAVGALIDRALAAHTLALAVATERR